MVTHKPPLNQRIRDLLAADKRSVSWLAEQVGIPYNTFNRRMLHPEQFTIRELLAVSDVLGAELMLGLGDEACPAHELVAA